jgi:hypothetical protein
MQFIEEVMPGSRSKEVENMRQKKKSTTKKIV